MKRRERRAPFATLGRSAPRAAEIVPLRSREPEELLRGGEGISVRTGRGGKVGERAGDGGRGLQIETGVGPAQRQLMVRSLHRKWNQCDLERALLRPVLTTCAASTKRNPPSGSTTKNSLPFGMKKR